MFLDKPSHLSSALLPLGRNYTIALYSIKTDMPSTTRHSCACLHQGDNCGPIFHLTVEKAESARFFGFILFKNRPNPPFQACTRSSCSSHPFVVYHSSLKVFNNRCKSRQKDGSITRTSSLAEAWLCLQTCQRKQSASTLACFLGECFSGLRLLTIRWPFCEVKPWELKLKAPLR